MVETAKGGPQLQIAAFSKLSTNLQSISASVQQCTSSLTLNEKERGKPVYHYHRNESPNFGRPTLKISPKTPMLKSITWIMCKMDSWWNSEESSSLRHALLRALSQMSLRSYQSKHPRKILWSVVWNAPEKYSRNNTNALSVSNSWGSSFTNELNVVTAPKLKNKLEWGVNLC